MKGHFLMNESLTQIAAISRIYGANLSYVFGGGGNTSCKTEKVLCVKPSGVLLATIQEDDFVQLDRAAIRAVFEAEIPSTADARESAVKSLMMATVLPGSKGRPSVEAPMHELYPQRFVVHLHPTLVNGMTCSVDAEAACRRLFPEAMWVPYVDPGFILSTEIRRLLEAYTASHGKAPRLTFMQNHGMVAAAETIAEIEAIHAEVFSVLKAHYAQAEVATELAMGDLAADAVAARAPAVRTLLGIGGKRAVVHSSAWFQPARGPFSPDHIVYAKSFAMTGEPTAEALASFRQERGYDPVIIGLPGEAVLAVGDSLKTARLAMDAARDAALVQQLTEAFGGPRHLPERDYRFIENWEVEQYRKQVTVGGSSAGRLDGKIALVTGGAQGFGYGIAQGLASEGATLIIADINADGAREAADRLQAEFGASRAFSAAVNIADEDSVAALAQEIARECGGLDILVANAGVLRAASVKSFAKKDWDFVTNVNYTGYFLCVKHLSVLMARQIVNGKGGWTDIVQINSKSGLEGSNRNAAYAGSKFGSIGLTQSFAMELVEDRVKVNAICPGNFFDGPLWSDPERGLFVQYLNTGKVPGAKSIADVRAFYEAKVPMGRGCTPVDVVRAILYCVEQEYETGQAIAVTGGQVMLR